MPVFQYRSATADGEVVEGELEAPDRDAVIRQLQARGQIPIQAVPLGTLAKAQPGRRGRGIAGNELLVFTTEFSSLLHAGLAIDRALDLLASAATSKPMGELIRDLERAVRGGAELSAAMSEHEAHFSRFYIGMIRAGEASGDLSGAMSRLASFVERAKALRESVVSALIYPVILLTVSVLSLVVILGVVVPRISQMFIDAGQRLPWYTELVVAAGDVVASYWWLMAVVAIAITVAIRHDYESIAGRERWDAFMLRLPVMGTFIRRLEGARFSRSLSVMLSNGVQLLDAVDIARAIVSNAVISRAVQRMVSSIRSGEGLAAPLLREGVLPEMAAKLVHVGEESGQLEQMLGKVADLYEREVATLVNRLVSVLAPALVLGLAAVIFVIMVTLIVPIITLNRLGL